MTYQKSIDQLHKPALSEMFSAMSGIVCAGVSMVKQTKPDVPEIIGLAQEAAILSYDTRLSLCTSKSGDEDKRANQAVEKFSIFFAAATPILSLARNLVLSMPRGEKGGTVGELLSHIDNILLREKTASLERLKETFASDTRISRASGSYLPVARKLQYEVSEKENAPKVKRGRPRKEKGMDV